MASHQMHCQSMQLCNYKKACIHRICHIRKLVIFPTTLCLHSTFCYIQRQYDGLYLHWLVHNKRNSKNKQLSLPLFCCKEKCTKSLVLINSTESRNCVEQMLPGVYFVYDVIRICAVWLVAVEVNKRIPVITCIFPVKIQDFCETGA